MVPFHYVSSHLQHSGGPAKACAVVGAFTVVAWSTRASTRAMPHTTDRENGDEGEGSYSMVRLLLSVI